jgi:hypothetical protein
MNVTYVTFTTLERKIQMIPTLHLESWAIDLIDNLKEGEMSIILCGCWSIWNERNSRKHAIRTLRKPENPENKGKSHTC